VKTHFGPFVFDLSNQLLWRGDQEVPLPPRVVGVLGLLVTRPGQVVSRQELIDTVWKDAFVSDTSLAEAISFLRQALGDDPQQPSYIQTVHRRGYRFLRPPESATGDDDVAVAEAVPARAARDPWALVLPWAIVVLLGATAATTTWRLAHPDAPLALPVARFDVALPPGTALDADAPAVAWSPSGERLAFVACAADGCRLFLRALDQMRAEPIAGTEGAAAPFFSPDESSVGFFADGKLKKIAVAGGTPVALADARHAFGAVWLDDDTIVFASALAGGLQRVAAAGGQPRPATTLDARAGELRHEQPEAIAGSRRFLVTAVLAPGSPLRSRIVAVSLETGQHTIVVDRASAPRFVAPNVLTFVRNGDLMAAAFDPSQMKVVGQPVVVATSVGEQPAQYAVSRVGSLAVASPAAESPAALVWAGRGAPLEPLPHAFQHLWAVQTSADGLRIAGVKAGDEPGELWWGAVDRGTLARLTFEGEHREPRWTPDGRALAFASRAGGAFNLFTRAVDDSAAPRRLTESAHHQVPGSISSDGTLVFTDFDASSGADIWAVALGGGPARPILQTPFDEMAPALSPDGTWLAYQSNESNRWEVYLRPLAGPGAAVPISAGGGASPAWSRDGRTLFYASRAGVMAVSVSECRAILPPSRDASADRRSLGGGGSGSPSCDLAPSTPLEIVRGPWIPRGTTPAGRLLVERARGRLAGVDRVSVTLQWTRELQRLLPAAVVSSPK
jgi:DNA-binding winged helix-turn-helix (wHTH) protein